MVCGDYIVYCFSWLPYGIGQTKVALQAVTLTIIMVVLRRCAIFIFRPHRSTAYVEMWPIVRQIPYGMGSSGEMGSLGDISAHCEV